ncbi:MAG: energy transducer TonB [Acidobacteria bacterium]|nr:energy transducer TonB [Acidobacteriota bacterium]
MSTDQKRAPLEQPSRSGHLTLRTDDGRPGEVRVVFEGLPQQRLGKVFSGAALWHGAIVALWFLFVWLVPDPVREAVLPDFLPRGLVFLAEPGPGGGGGGGNRLPEPPKRAELAGREKISVPALEPEPTPEPTPEEPPLDQLNIPAQMLAAATETSPGVIESDQASRSTGPGGGSGAGAGEGSGLGQGTGGGIGGGIYRPGSGVINPRILREVKPQYTADAMRAKVQGTVLLEAVVLADGTVGRIDVVKSLDPTFGLDQEAVRAAKQWRFLPGTRFGEPVAVLVTIELTFTLR